MSFTIWFICFDVSYRVTSGFSLQVRVAREFVPPGEIIWLERYKVTKQRLKPPAAAAADTALSNPNSSAGLQSAAESSTEAAAAAQAAAGSTAATASSMLRAGSRGLAAALAAAPSAVAGKRTALYLRPHFTDGLSLIVGGMVVSRNMFLDHVPDNQLAQLKRLVRRLKQQQVMRMRNGITAGDGAAEGAAAGGRWAAGASADVPLPQQVMPERQHVVHFAV
jgi:hypothetical protein